jgi:uncharacterized UPF0160 family protein
LDKNGLNNTLCQALEEMLNLYQSLVEDEFQVSDEMLAICLTKISRFLRLFMDELMVNFKEEEKVLEKVLEKSEVLCQVHDHFALQVNSNLK